MKADTIASRRLGSIRLSSRSHGSRVTLLGPSARSEQHFWTEKEGRLDAK
jgi:hypothetical protein